MRIIQLFLFPMSMLLLATGLSAQLLPAGPQVLTFHSSIDDTEQPYGLYLPPNYDGTRPYPLVVMLHGAGSNHRLALRRVFGKSNANGETDVEASRYFPDWESEDFIVVSPLARGTMGYQGIAEEDVLAVVADVKRRFSIDENRTYLTGLSMGGGGTLWLGLSYPDMWAAIAPVCPAPPEGSAPLAPNALNYPVYIFQGGADPVVRPETVRAWVDRFKAEGVDVNYAEYPGVGHDSWVNAYRDQAIFDWFGQFKRNPFPERVRFVTQQYKHNKAYWVSIDAFNLDSLAEIDARFLNPNELSIRTNNLAMFSLQLQGHPLYRPGQALLLTIDGQALRAATGENLQLQRQGNKWIVATMRLATPVKKAGLEGPMSELLAHRHVYVYGTGGNPSPQEIEARRAQAIKAANWSYYRGEFLGRVMVFPRVLSDKEVRPSDLQEANLLLFGDSTTNSVVAHYSDHLPLRLPAANADSLGLAYIFPVGERLVLVNSGRSIMEAPDSGKAIDGLSRYASPAIVLALKKFDDYVLFTPTDILAQGRFNNQWQLSPAQRQQLQAAGAILKR